MPKAVLSRKNLEWRLQGCQGSLLRSEDLEAKHPAKGRDGTPQRPSKKAW